MAMKASYWIAIAVVVALVLNLGGITDTISGYLSPGATPEPGTPATKCYIEDTTLTVGPAVDAFVPSTKLTTEYHRVILNDVDKGLVADSSTLTVNPNDKVCIYYGENSSTYYAAEQCFTVPCQGAVTSGSQPDSDAYKLYKADRTMTVRVFNENNGNLNSGNDNQSLTAGDVKTLDMNIIGTYQRAYSPYGNMLAVVEANNSIYDAIVIGQYPTAALPNQHKNAGFGVDAVNWVYSMPGIKGNEKISTTVTLDVDDSTAPADPRGGVGDINVTLYDSDWFMDKDGKMKIGVENATYQDVGSPNTNFSILVQ